MALAVTLIRETENMEFFIFNFPLFSSFHVACGEKSNHLPNERATQITWRKSIENDLTTSSAIFLCPRIMHVVK